MNASNVLLLLGLGGSLVNQISTYRPLGDFFVWKVWVPGPTSFCLSTLVNEARPAGATDGLLPTSMATLAPAVGPKVICTELRLTGLPMSRSRPVPFFRLPNAAEPR